LRSYYATLVLYLILLSLRFMRLMPMSILFPYTTLFRSKWFANPGLARYRRAPGPDGLLAAAGNKLDRPRSRRMQDSGATGDGPIDRKSTRLNSSHVKISYAVFCLKKKTVANPLRSGTSS